MNSDHDLLAGLIRVKGEPYDGITLQVIASDVKVTCAECGVLPPPGLHGWSADWLTLCQEGRAHALMRGPGHEVAVSLWSGAVYAPVQERDQEGGDDGGSQAAEGAQEAQAAPGRF